MVLFVAWFKLKAYRRPHQASNITAKRLKLLLHGRSIIQGCEMAVWHGSKYVSKYASIAIGLKMAELGQTNNYMFY